MLRHPSDWRTLVHLAACAAALAASLRHSAAWWPLYAFLAVHVVAAQHNHAHRPVFRARPANVLLDHVSAVLCGIPMFCWRIHHLRSHHPAPWTDDDWSTPYRRTDGGRRIPVGYRHYQIVYLGHFWGRSLGWVQRCGSPRARRAVLAQITTLALASVALAAWAGIGRWLAIVPTCYLVCGMALGAVNYVQHWAAGPPGAAASAWTFTGRVHNFLNYNAGYHLLHHARPHLHWRELPEMHAADPSYAPRHLVEHGSFPAYRSPRRRAEWLAAAARKAAAGGETAPANAAAVGRS